MTTDTGLPVRPTLSLIVHHSHLCSTDSSEPARSTHAVWDEIGEAMIRELDFSRVILKLNAADKDSSEQIIASTTIDMNVFLEAALVRPTPSFLDDPC